MRGVHRDDFIPPQPDDAVEFLQSATIVFDTNVLLAPYRLSAQVREEALAAIESVAGRVWLPYQVGVEFYRNYPANRDERSRAYENAIGEVGRLDGLVTKHLGTKKTHEDLRKDILRAVREAVDGLQAAIRELRERDAALTTVEHDRVLERIEAAVGDRVGSEPDPSTLRARVREFAEWRQPNLIPPGFQDRGKEGLSRRAGDFLLWAEVLEFARANRADVLLVTNDAKDDWWEAVDGEWRPHTLLVREFQRKTGREYHQVSLEDFVRMVAEAAGREADEATLQEIEAVAEESRVEEVVATQTRAADLMAKYVDNISRLGSTYPGVVSGSAAYSDALSKLGVSLSNTSLSSDPSKHVVDSRALLMGSVPDTVLAGDPPKYVVGDALSRLGISISSSRMLASAHDAAERVSGPRGATPAEAADSPDDAQDD